MISQVKLELSSFAHRVDACVGRPRDRAHRRLRRRWRAWQRKLVHMSSGFSIPIDTQIRAGVIPNRIWSAAGILEWVIEAGWDASDSVPPQLTASLITFRRSRTAKASTSPPFTSKPNVDPAPAHCFSNRAPCRPSFITRSVLSVYWRPLWVQHHQSGARTLFLSSIDIVKELFPAPAPFILIPAVTKPHIWPLAGFLKLWSPRPGSKRPSWAFLEARNKRERPPPWSDGRPSQGARGDSARLVVWCLLPGPARRGVPAPAEIGKPSPLLGREIRAHEQPLGVVAEWQALATAVCHQFDNEFVYLL